MALDHYVSQVHLRNFYSPTLGELMYAIRKRDGKEFTPNSESVCRIEEGSTNAYLVHDRLIEDFLKIIEPKYNATVARLTADKIDQECVYVVAGFVAFIMTCSPAGMRLQTPPLKAILESSSRVLDAANVFPKPPELLGGATLTDLLQGGKIQFTIDPKFPQAMGIANILKITSIFGNCAWEVLQNTCQDSPFFTSDFPVAIEKSGDPRVVNRIVPLTPNLAVRIRPDISKERDDCDLSFRHFRHRVRSIGRKEVAAVNRLLVKCAEEHVFYRDNLPWVRPFIMKHGLCRVETLIQEIPLPKGAMLVARQRIAGDA